MFLFRDWNDDFDLPVPVRIGRTDGIRHIGSAREAASILLDEWPETAGPAYVEACRACLAAARGKSPVGRARSALVEAARETGILMDGCPLAGDVMPMNGCESPSL